METQNVEYKQSWKDEYLKWVCGFANAQGGTIFIGVSDIGEIVGIKNARKLMEDIPNKINMSMGVIADVDLLSKDDKNYISITVRQSNTPISFKGKYYYRSGSTLQEMTGVALHDFIMRKMNITWDSTIQPEATLEDIDREAIDFFLKAAIRSRRIDPSVQNDSTERILRNLQLINSQAQLTMAALLLFGKDIERWNMTAKFRIGRFGHDIADLIMQDNVFCPLILMPNKVMSILRSNYLISPIRYDGLQRIENLEIPEEALREMICNAIVHRDYLGTFIHMRVWDNKIELWNPGSLPPNLTVEDLMHNHESQPRNRLIANVFYLAGFIESWGRGYEKIRNTFVLSNLQLPTFSQVHGGFLIEMPREIFLESRDKVNVDSSSHGNEQASTKKASGRASRSACAKSVEIGVEKSVEIGVEKSVEKSVEKIKNNPRITVRELTSLLGLSRRGVEKNMKKLQEKGLLRRIGPDNGGHWEIIEK